ncbi:MAG: hypothetical protein AUK34_02175 [Ignavibacteria bacterium CG2_30_36_16]|nr:hypothetical protein [Ignavibacteria bacterium]OIP63155.1 MAG: hypothetical protein AUK34_02175 [Ignavibacteria bacterium CG2_30_36_16]PJB01698.1 MAG: hypothetical protein CO127_02470 [Ignavibacteria bacterium CG_4_9_14_3_um_filter_36_18]
MRVIILLAFSILFVYTSSFCQSNISDEVKEIFNIGKDIIDRNVNKENIREHISYEQSKIYAKKLSQAIVNDPLGFNIYLSQEYLKWKEETKKNNYKPVTVKPAYKLYMLEQVIENYFGETFSNVISTPYFLRVKVIALTTSIYTSKSAKIKTKQTDLLVEVEDILKGKKYINIGDSIRISYLNWWINQCDIKFEKGKSYLLPIKLTECIENEGCINYTLKVFDNECKAIKEIENELVKRPESILGNMTAVKWQQFKSEFIKKYLNF